MVEQPVELVLRLQAAQAGRVGRGDIDGQIAGEGRKARHPFHIVGDPVGRVLVRADIDPDDAGLALAQGEPLHRVGMAAIVEAEAIDHRPIFRQPEQARLRVSILGAGRQRSDLDEAEAEPQQRIRHHRILVVAGGKPDRIGEGDPGDFDAKPVIDRNLAAFDETLAKSCEGKIVSAFGIEPEEGRPRQAIEGAHRTLAGKV